MNLKLMGRKAAMSGLLLATLLQACSDKPETLLASAKEYMAKNDSKAAVIQLKNVLQSNPDLPEARFLLGSALLEGGDPVGGETELRKALDLKHPQDQVVPALAKALLLQGQAKKLIDEFGKSELSQPGAKANLQTSLAMAFAQTGKAELAQEALSAALQADPAYVPALIAQARQKAAHKDFDGAMVLADEVVSKSPKSHEGWHLKGDLLLYARNQPEEALAAYRKAVDIKPDFLPSQGAAITLLLKQGKNADASAQIDQLKKIAPNHPQTKYLQAQLAYQSKDFKATRELLQQVLKTSANNVQALQLAGAVELQLGSPVQAEGYLSRALQIAPGLGVARRLLVMTYLRSGQSAKALATLLPGLNQEIVDPELISLAGEAYLQNGDVKKAQEYFEKASKQAPDDAKKKTALALTHLMGGQTDSAFQELEQIAASDKGSTADMALISAHLRRKDFDKALAAIDGLEKKQPDKPIAANLRGKTLLAKQDIVGARKSFEKALAIDPTFFPAVASLAALDLADKKPEDAKKRFQAVLAKDPKNVQALMALADMAARAGAGVNEVVKLIGEAIAANPSEPTPRLLLIDYYMRNKDPKSAALAAQNAAAALPDNAEVLDALGRTQHAAGDVNQAIAAFTKLAGMRPLLPQPHMRLAQVYLAAKDRKAAQGSLRRALELKQDLLEAQQVLIALELEDKKFPEAVKIAREVQKQRPKEAAGYVLEGDIRSAEKNFEAAATAYRDGLKQVNSPELAVKLHAVLVFAGKAADADKFATQWLKDNPKDAAFLFYMGDRAIARNDYAAAEKFYAGVIKQQDTNAIAFNNLAWVTAKQGKPGALAYAEKALSLAPDQPAFMDTLALLLSEKGDYAKALEWQKKALAMQPQNPSFKLGLAKIHIAGGKKDLARKELDELTKLGNQFPAQAEVSSLLKAM